MNEMKFRTIVMTADNKYVLVDSRLTLDHGFETMVFRCTIDGHVLCWDDLDCEWYENCEEMCKGHNAMVERWSQKTLL